ncbi:MAG: tetratricopeptide repeat protein [Deltaproteobacteria bacterium]|jgi:TolA-binding protein|nr:tetratricopeptide repeat protein [Deltaproteobacteria bacterium]
MTNRNPLVRWAPILLSLSLLLGAVQVQAAPRQAKKKQKNAALSPLVDLDGILDKTDRQKEEKAGPRSMGELLDSRRLSALVDVKLDEEIGLAKQLIGFDNTCDGASPVRFRLGDLYWEKSKRAFFVSQNLDLPKAKRVEAKSLMAKYQKETKRWYGEIVKQCPGYEALPKVLYYLGRVYVELGRAKAGARYFKRIIQEHLDSEWAGRSWFMIGEYYFDTAQDIEKALQAYERASQDSNQSVTGFALYKEGWCYINTGEWEVALRRFESVIKWIEAKKLLEEGPASGLRREALKDYVRAYSNIQPEFSVKGLGKPDKAFEVFGKVASTDEVPRLIEELGQLYRNRDSHQKVVLIYNDLAKRFPSSMRQTIWQSYVLEALSRSGTRKQIIFHLEKLCSMLGDLWSADQANPVVDRNRKKQLLESFDVAERIVRNLGLERHKEGRRLRGKARSRSFRFAADVYEAYLGAFGGRKLTSEVDYPYYVQFYQAELFLELGLLDKAAGAFEAVAAKGEAKTSGRERKMALRAAEESVHAFEAVWQDQLEAKTSPEIIVKTEDAFALSAGRYLSLVGRKKDPQSVGVRYKVGKIAYDRGQLDKAIEQFEILVTRHGKNKVACIAANLILDIHNGSKDFVKLEERARVFARMKSLSCSAKERKALQGIAQQAAFGLVKERAQKNEDPVSVAKSYLDYFRKYSSSSLGDKALYHAAIAYEKAGDSKQSAKIKFKLIKKFPKSELARETLFAMAADYENSVQVVKARKLFERFATSYPEDERAPVVWLKVAAFSRALGDKRGAQRAFEKVGSDYVSHPQAHLAGVNACKPLEMELEDYRKDGFKPSKKRAELLDKCYARWLSKPEFRTRDADLRCYVLTRRAQLYGSVLNNQARASGYQKDADVVWQSIADNVASERRRCSDVRAEIGFRGIESGFKKFGSLKLSPLDPTNAKAIKIFKASLAVVTSRRDVLLREYQRLAALGSETWSVAAAYRAGAVLMQSVDKLLTAPIASTLALSVEDEQLVREGLREKAMPLRELAKSRFEDCLAVSRALAVGGDWVEKARGALAKMNPLGFGKSREKWIRPEQSEAAGGVLRLFKQMSDGMFKNVDVLQVRGVRDLPPKAGSKP